MSACPMDPVPSWWRPWQWSRTDWWAVAEGFASLTMAPPRRSPEALLDRAAADVVRAVEHVSSCPRCRFQSMTEGMGKSER